MTKQRATLFTTLGVLAVAHGLLIARSNANWQPLLPYLGLAAALSFIVLFLRRLDRCTPFAESGPATDAPTRVRSPTLLVLIVLDLILLTAGALFSSLWLCATAAVVLVIAVCLQCRERGYRRSLAYLCPLLLFAVGSPNAFRSIFTAGLWQLTGGAADWLLDQLGYLHLWQRPLLMCPEKSFALDSVTSGGAQSLWGLLFVATLMAVWRRRRVLHLLISGPLVVLLASAVCVTRICATATAWDAYAIDLNTGVWAAIAGCLALVVLIGLWVCVDSLVSFVTDPIPDPDDLRFWSRIRVIVSDVNLADMANPLNNAWNRRFQQPESLVAERAVVPKREGQGESTPEVSDLLRPSYQFVWLKVFLESWFKSRARHRLLVALPAVIIGAVACLWLLSIDIAPRVSVADRYEAILSDSPGHADAATRLANLCFRKLLTLRPFDSELRFRFVLHNVEQGDPDTAVEHLRMLTPPDASGYVPARLWLVGQAQDSAATLPLSAHEIHQQLLRAAAEDSKNARVHQWLAAIYLSGGQPRLAEGHLLTGIESDPGLELPLAWIQRQLGRDDAEVASRLVRAGQAFENELQSAPANQEARRNLATVRLLQNRFADAEQALADGVAATNSSAAKADLASHYRERADLFLEQSEHNRDPAAELITKALQLSPSDPASIQTLLRLKLLGATFEGRRLRPVIAYWQDRLAETTSSDDEQLVLAQLLICADRHRDAVEVLEPLAKVNPRFRSVLARQLLASGDHRQGGRQLQQLLSEYQHRIDADASDTDATADFAELLVATAEAQRARDFLLRRLPDSLESNNDRRLQAAFIRACLTLFERQSKRIRNSDDAHQAASLLADVLRVDQANQAALQRVTQHAFSETLLAAPAKQLLNGLVAAGAATADLHNMAGSHALLDGKMDVARRHFERAHRQAPEDPIAMNGLALTLVRLSADNHQQALELADEALQRLPGHPNVLATRAEVHLATGNVLAAKADLELSLARLPDNRKILELLVTVYESLQQSDLADEHREKLNRLQGD